MKFDKRLSKLESQKNHKSITLADVAWTDEQLAFRNDIHKRMEEANTTFYHDVCNDEEFERIQKQSTQASLIAYHRSKMDSTPE